MKSTKYLILAFCILLICTGCTTVKQKPAPITSISTHGVGSVTNFDQNPLFLLNGMLYALDAATCELELFCDIENCAHHLSEVLTEPSSCPAALGKGFIIGSYEDKLYAAVNGAGWYIYTYSDTEKCFKLQNHILEISDFNGAFHKNYFYYFSLGSLKRIELVEDAESEIVLENLAGSEHYTLSGMAFFDDILVMNGGLTTVDTWIYNINSNELIKADIQSTTPEYYNGKLYFINGTEGEYTLYSYTPETEALDSLIEFRTTSMNTRIAVDDDYIYMTLYEDIQPDAAASSSTLAVYKHDGQLVKQIPLDPIENDAMKTVMCSNHTYIFLGNSNAIFDQSLWVIEKDSLWRNYSECEL